MCRAWSQIEGSPQPLRELIRGLIPGDGDQPLEEVEAVIGVGAFEPRDTSPRPSCDSNEAGLGAACATWSSASGVARPRILAVALHLGVRIAPRGDSSVSGKPDSLLSPARYSADTSAGMSGTVAGSMPTGTNPLPGTMCPTTVARSSPKTGTLRATGGLSGVPGANGVKPVPIA